MTDLNFADNEIECAHCSASFYYELTRCPKCNTSVYEPEYDQGDWDEGIEPRASYKAKRWANSLLVILMGWLVAGAVAIIAYIFLRRWFFWRGDAATFQVLIYACTSVGAFAGGFISGRFARLSRTTHGLVTGFLSLSIAWLLNMRDFGHLIINLITLLGWIAIIGSAYAGAWLAARLLRDELASQLFVQTIPQSEEALYQNLLEKTRFDEQVAERLITYEHKRDPQASRTELIHSAILRWESDNR